AYLCGGLGDYPTAEHSREQGGSPDLRRRACGQGTGRCVIATTHDSSRFPCQLRERDMNSKKLMVKPGKKLDLADHDPDDTHGLTKGIADGQLEKHRLKLDQLQELLY